LRTDSFQESVFPRYHMETVLKKLIHSVMFAAAFITSSSALAAELGTAEEAATMVKKAVAYLKANGKDVSALKDADGKEFIKEILSKAKSGGKGNADYKWPNPVSAEIQPQTVYFEKADDMVFSSGYYRK